MVFFFPKSNNLRLPEGQMQITVLCENTVGTPFPWGLIGEHGQSFLIEGRETTLYDTGQGIGLINNMALLGKNPKTVDRVVLSHGHYDHTGGLLKFLENREAPVPVFVHREAFQNKVAMISPLNSPMFRSIGFQHTQGEYEEKGADFRFIRSFSRISPEISAISDINRPKEWRSSDTRLKTKEGDTIIADPFNDDLTLLVETDAGPVVLLGCAHAGVVEILNDLSEKSGYKTFHAVIGGTHLGPVSRAYVEQTIDVLKHYQVNIVGTNHCTGFHASALIKSRLEKEFVMASVGSVFHF